MLTFIMAEKRLTNVSKHKTLHPPQKKTNKKKEFVTISFSELLLLAGVELGCQRQVHINYLDKSKSSPLHLAVRGGNIEAIYFCIANGAKIDQQQVEYIIYELVHQNQ